MKQALDLFLYCPRADNWNQRVLCVPAQYGDLVSVIRITFTKKPRHFDKNTKKNVWIRTAISRVEGFAGRLRS